MLDRMCVCVCFGGALSGHPVNRRVARVQVGRRGRERERERDREREGEKEREKLQQLTPITFATR